MDDAVIWKCAFCRSLEAHRIGVAIANKTNHSDGPPLLEEYTVAIVARSWIKGQSKRGAGRSTDYRYQGLGYKLNYCPECGKKIERRRRNAQN